MTPRLTRFSSIVHLWMSFIERAEKTICPGCKSSPKMDNLTSKPEIRTLNQEMGRVEVEVARHKVFLGMAKKCIELFEEAKAAWLEDHDCPKRV